MRRLVGLACALAFSGSSSLALAVEPWSDADPPEPPVRTTFGDYGIRPGAEYRAAALYINPISPSSPYGRRVSWMEHRLRLDGTLDYKDKVRLVVSSDVLDGVLWGDNGNLGSQPAPNSGTNVNTKNPNNASPCVTLRGADPLDPNAYGYGLCEAEPVKVRHLYGEVVTPVGLLRIGRQPVNIGTGIQNADGNGRPNRFGFSRAGNSVDRVLFATKPLEAFKAKEDRNLSPNEGLILALAYDRYVGDDPHLFRDDVNQLVTAFRFAAPRYSFGRDLLIAGNYAYRFDKQYTTRIHNVGLRAMSRFGDVYAGFEAVTNLGTTREISTAYGLITNDPPIDQTIRSVGARAVTRYDRPTWSAYLEFDFASGDPDPTPRTPLTQFTFAEDTNVGLLLFKHVMAFQSARSAASGVELLRRLGATTYPAEAVNTRGSFTNAIAIFPQFDVRPHEDVLFRFGTLFAWAAVPVNDAIASLRARDGNTIDDDLVNFAGGKPARYYGTELDGRFQWRYEKHFLFDLEGAVLIPGPALQNADGRAVRSVLVQGRTTFLF